MRIALVPFRFEATALLIQELVFARLLVRFYKLFHRIRTIVFNTLNPKP